MKPSIGTVLLLFVSFVAYSQKDLRPGYILQQGDTIRGFVKYREGKSALTKCTFYKTKESESQDFTPETLLGYGIKGRNFRSMNPDTAVQFVEVLVEGKASLFGRGNHFIITRDSAIVVVHSEQKEVSVKGNTYLTEDKAYANNLRNLLGDCPDVVKPLLKMRLYALSNEQKEKIFTKMVTEYNVCHGSNPVVKKIKTKPETHWGAFAGVSLSDAQLSEGGRIEEYDNTINPAVGAFFNYTEPRISEKLQFRIELILGTYKSAFNRKEPPYTYSSTVAYKYVRVPVSFSYKFLTGKVSPYVRAGVAFTCAVDQIFDKKLTYSLTNGNMIVQRREDYEIRTMYLNFLGGVGAEWTLPSEKVLFMEARIHDKAGILNNYYSISMNVRTVNLFVGIRF